MHPTWLRLKATDSRKIDLNGKLLQSFNTALTISITIRIDNEVVLWKTIFNTFEKRLIGIVL